MKSEWRVPRAFVNDTRGPDWQIQQQFSGSTFDTTTQLLSSLGTDYAWAVFYHGQMYDGGSRVYPAEAFQFDPRAFGHPRI